MSEAPSAPAPQRRASVTEVCAAFMTAATEQASESSDSSEGSPRSPPQHGTNFDQAPMSPLTNVSAKSQPASTIQAARRASGARLIMAPMAPPGVPGLPPPKSGRGSIIGKEPEGVIKPELTAKILAAKRRSSVTGAEFDEVPEKLVDSAGVVYEVTPPTPDLMDAEKEKQVDFNFRMSMFQQFDEFKTSQAQTIKKLQSDFHFIFYPRRILSSNKFLHTQTRFLIFF